MPEGTQLVGLLDDNSYNAVEKAKTIVAQTNADFPHIIASSEMSSYLNVVYAIPWTIFVDSEGKIVGQPLIGSRRGSAYRQAIENILAQESGNSVTLRVDGAGGNLTADKPIAKAGENVIVAYTPDNGYELDEVWAYKTGDEDTTIPLSCTETECTFTMPDYPVTVAASFKTAGDVPDYPVTLPAPAAITGGSLTANAATAEAGETVTVVYTPEAGYELEAIWVYKTSDESTTVPFSCVGNICTFTMPDYPVTVRVSFKKTETSTSYPITLSPVTGGNLTAGITAATAGEVVAVIYTANSGYEFQRIWGYKTGDESTTVPLSCSGNICTFTMPAYPVTITASFTRVSGSNPVPSNPVSSNPESGSLNSAGGGCNVSALGVEILALAGIALLRRNRKQ
jgi:hypothetical protein